MDNNQMQGGGPGRPQGPGGQKQPDNGRNKNNGKKQGGGKSILVFLVITLIVMLATNIVTSMVKRYQPSVRSLIISLLTWLTAERSNL